MKIELPIPNMMTLHKVRSKDGVNETFAACTAEVFDLAEHDPMDIHVVAEWRQSWGTEYAEPGDGLSIARSDWNAPFLEDKNFMRIVMIDGKFYAPMKSSTVGTSTEFVRTNELQRVLSGPSEVFDYHGRHADGFWASSYRAKVSKSGIAFEPGMPTRDILPDMKGRTVVRETGDHYRSVAKAHVADIVSVEGLIWTQVSEPMLVLTTQDGNAILDVKQTETLLLPPDRAVAFALNDYDAAVEYAEVNYPDRKLQRLIKEAKVFLPSVFQRPIEVEELVRCVDYMIFYAGDHLKLLPRSVGNAWYELRDLRAGEELLPDAAKTEELADAVRRFAVEMSCHSYQDKILTDMSATGLRVTERWAFRPVGGSYDM